MKSGRRTGTVRGRTALVAAAVVLVALGASAIGLVWLVRKQLVDADRTATELRAKDVLALASAQRLPHDLSFPGEEDAATQIIDRTGHVVSSTENLETTMPFSSLRPEPGDSETEIHRIKDLDDHHDYVVVAVAGEHDGLTVLSATSLESTGETVSELTRGLLIGTPILVLIVGATTRLLVGRALRPVRAITREVSDITDTELSRRVPEPGTADEIAELAATMNQMLARLEAASVRQRRFVADASHELRSPLASARTTLEVASLHPDSTESLLSAIDDALIDHDRLDHLTLDLLELAKLDQQRMVIDSTPVDVDQVLHELLERRSEGNIETDLRAGIHDVSERMLSRVITNVLDNAARHRATRTALSAETTPQDLEISVEDDGPGIPGPDRQRVFEPFTRLDEARVAEEGTGLGLAIVKGLVESVGGTVTIEESRLGGAKVTMHLPTRRRSP